MTQILVFICQKAILSFFFPPLQWRNHKKLHPQTLQFAEPKPEEPKEAPPAPTESAAPDTSGTVSNGSAPEGDRQNTDIFKNANSFH